MKKIILISITFFSCTLLSNKKIQTLEAETFQKKIIHPGEVVYLSFISPWVKGAKLMCKGNTFIHHYDGEKISAYISETYFTHFKPFRCTYNKKLIAEFHVKDKNFPEEKLKVIRKKVVLSSKDQARVAKEWKFLKNIYNNGIERPLFKDSFKKPMNSFITSIYGTRRTFNNIRKSQHLGTDFRAKVGTPIRASNTGKVVVSRNLFYSGNTIVIDHGMGIFTVYGHLSKLKVKENSMIKKSALIGLSGKTGRITGPHLHWGVKVNGNYVDGNYLVEIGNKSIAGNQNR